MKLSLILSSILLISVASGAPAGELQGYPGGKTLADKLKTAFGIYAEEITDHSLFEAYGGITYEIKIPDEANRKFFKFFKYLCDGFSCEEGQDCENKKAACSFYSFYMDVENNVEAFLFPSDESFKFSGGEDQSLKLDCEGVTEPFGRSTMTPEEKIRFLRSLNACAEQRVLNVDVYGNFEENRRLDALIHANTKFTEIFKNTFSAVLHHEFTEIKYPLEYSVGYAAAAAHDGIGFTEALAEVLRWKDAASECKQRKIPKSVISRKMLAESLEKFQLEKLDIYKNEVLMQFPENLSFYQENQLTDCVRVNDSLFIRILIPLKKTNEDWRLFGVKSVQYVTSPMQDPQVCSIKDLVNEKYFAIEMHTRRILPMKKPKGRRTLARVSSEGLLDNSLQAFRSSCGFEVARKLAGGNETNLEDHQHCKVVCEPGINFRVPLVTRIYSDTFFVAGVVPKGDRSRETYPNLRMYEHKHNGGIEIRVGCDKFIDIRREKFFARYPCKKTINSYENVTIGP